MNMEEDGRMYVCEEPTIVERNKSPFLKPKEVALKVNIPETLPTPVTIPDMEV